MTILPCFRAPTRAPRTKAAVAAIGFAALLASGFAGEALAQPPRLDIGQTCRAAAATMIKLMGGSKSHNYFEHCAGSEQKAHDQIIKEWATFSGSDKAQCLHTKAYLPNYVEWQTCLEMARDSRHLRANKAAPAQPGAAAVAKLPAVNEPRRAMTSVGAPSVRQAGVY